MSLFGSIIDQRQDCIGFLIIHLIDGPLITFDRVPGRVEAVVLSAVEKKCYFPFILRLF